MVEITKPYKLWKFSQNATTSTSGRPTGKYLDTGHVDQHENVQAPQAGGSPDTVALPHTEVGESASTPEDSMGASVIIMAFLTIPLLLLIGIGSLMRLRDSGTTFH